MSAITSIRRVVPQSSTTDFEFETGTLSASEEMLAISAIGEWSAAEVWLKATDVDWAVNVRVLLYGRVRGARVLLQSRTISGGLTTVDGDDKLHAFVISYRGPRVTAYEVCLVTEESELPGTAIIYLRTWSNEVELPYVFDRSDVAAEPDRVVMRDGDGRARFVGIDLHGPSVLWDVGQSSGTIGWSGADPSGVGGGLAIYGQQGASGSRGGNLTLGAGNGGDAESQAGDFIVDLGNLPSYPTASAGLVLRAGGIDRAVVETVHGPSVRWRALSGGALGFSLLSTLGDEIGLGSGLAVMTGMNSLYFQALDNTFYWRGAATAQFRVDSCVPTGACSQTWSQSVTSVTETFATKTSDAATGDRVWEAQDAYATATTNLDGGGFVFRLGAPKPSSAGMHGPFIVEADSDHAVEEYYVRGQTTDDTATIIWEYEPPGNGVYHVELRIGAVADSVDDSMSALIVATVQMRGGNATLLHGGPVHSSSGDLHADLLVDTTDDVIQVEVESRGDVPAVWSGWVRVYRMEETFT